MELPECPVCLQTYDGEGTIPRVLACGHTACEACLIQLPQGFPLTIRCPACTQLVKYPSQGPSGLPKNIDLLRLSLSQNSSSGNSQKSVKEVGNDRRVRFIPNLWSDEFYSTWKGWVIPYDDVLVESGAERNVDDDDDDQGLCFGLQGRMGGKCSGQEQPVSLVRVSSLCCINDLVFKFSYVWQIMKCLNGMKEEVRNELGLILNVSNKQSRVSTIYGLWGNLEDGFLYLVCERHCDSVLEKWGFDGGEGDGLSKDGVSGFAMMGMDMYEAVIGLHLEGLIVGCLGLSCLNYDVFGHVYVNLNEALMMGRKVHQDVVAICGTKRVGDEEIGVMFAKVLKSNIFASPELFLELLQKEGLLDSSRYRYSVGYSSDVWSLGCTLLRLLIGKPFNEELVNYVNHFSLESSEKGSFDCASVNMECMEKVTSLLGSKFGTEFESTWKILRKCLNFDPGNRPLVTDVWKCIRELIIRSQHDILAISVGKVNEDNRKCCLVLGELCQLWKERSKTEKLDELEGREEIRGANYVLDKDIVEALSSERVRFKDMEGHRDCVAALAVGGNFLFSSSYDKTICVWSLQDFSHIHSFRGHEHKIMALVYVDEEQPLCISGDNGGGIFVWGISNPLGQEPLKKWYEQNDWRYSGIHALAVSGSKYLYTGSGDKSIKAWSLQDYALSCTMNGHKSVVSALAICDGILYSGSYDGTIRLWSLNDHSPLTILGEDMSGNVTSVLSLTADRHMLVAAHENGSIKIWRNDVFVKSTQMHNGAIFAVGMEGKSLFTGGWDKTINVQELLGDDFHMDARQIGSIECESIITALLCWQGKLFVGCADRLVKVYYYGK